MWLFLCWVMNGNLKDDKGRAVGHEEITWMV